jgi:RHS repeat-associated protein
MRPTGTITVTDYDGLDRAIDEKVGTSDANLVMTAQYQYDKGVIGDGNLTQETDYPGGSAPARVTQYFYDWRDRLVALKQGVQASENDGTHRPILYYQLDNLGHVLTNQRYDGDGVTITSTNGVPIPPSASLLRAQTTKEYDEQGRVYQTNVYSVDQSSGTVSANSLTTNTWYGHRGDLIKTSAPGGLVTKSLTDGAGRVTVVYQTDGAGDSTWNDASSVVNNNVLNETDTQYDADGNPILVIDKQRFDNETATGALGNPTTSPKARDYYTASYFDSANRLTDQVDVGTNGGTPYTRPSSVPADSPTVLVTHRAYNPAGLVQSVTDPRGIVTQNSYDLLGRTTQTVQDYTGGGPSNSSDQTTQYTYDGDGHVLTMTALLPGSSETTQYTYGVTTATSGLNSNDLLASATYPSNGQNDTESYTYNALGEGTGYTDRNGTTHSYLFDVLGRQTSDQVTTLGSGVDGTIRRLDTAYDTGGRPYLFTSYADVAGTTIVDQVQRSYNGLGQLTSEAQSHSGAANGSTPSVQYGYSFVATAGGPNYSRPVSITYPNGRVINDNYGTGTDNTISRLTSISDSSATLEAYTYLGLDTVVQRSHPQNGVNQTYITPGGNGDGGDQYTGLDRFGRVVEQRWVNTNTNANTDDFQYSNDQDGNVLTRTNALNSSFNEQYAYDNLNRLTSFSRGSSTTESWSLDVLGNWLSVTTNGTTQTRTANAQNQVTAISGATTPAYDNNGNTLQDDQNHSYVYDAWNRIVKVTAGSNTETFAYDALGRRIRTTLNSNPATDLYYSAAWQVVEEDVAGSMSAQYVWSPVYVDAMVERDTSSGQRLYVQQDANWNVTALVDTSGNVQERYVYDPYGKPSILDPSWNARTSSLFSWLYLYQGGRYDLGSGFYNFRNRDLSPTLGRWMEQDPAGYAAGDNNLYGEEGDGPTSNLDPSGLGWLDSPFVRGVTDRAAALTQGLGELALLATDVAQVGGYRISQGLNYATGGYTDVYEPNLNSRFSQGLPQAQQNGNVLGYSTAYVVNSSPIAVFPWAFNVGQQGAQAVQSWWRTGDPTALQQYFGGLLVDAIAILGTSAFLKQLGGEAAPPGEAVSPNWGAWWQGIVNFFKGEDAGVPLGEEPPAPNGQGSQPGQGEPVRCLQTGGNTISKSTAEDLELPRREAGRAMEALKKDYGLPNNFHGKIMSNGDLVNPQTGETIGNLFDYLP